MCYGSHMRVTSRSREKCHENKFGLQAAVIMTIMIWMNSNIANSPTYSAPTLTLWILFFAEPGSYLWTITGL
jgi:hypothetical protein